MKKYLFLILGLFVLACFTIYDTYALTYNEAVADPGLFIDYLIDNGYNVGDSNNICFLQRYTVNGVDRLEYYYSSRDYSTINYVASYPSYYSYSGFSSSKFSLSYTWYILNSDSTFSQTTFSSSYQSPVSTRIPISNIFYSSNNLYSSTSYDSINFSKNYVCGQRTHESTPVVSYNYFINYYFDGVLDSTKTIEGSEKKDTILTYTDYSSDYYILDDSYSIDLSLSSDNKVINIYYKSKLYNYTINYYFDGVLDSSKTIEGSDKKDTFISFKDYSSYFNILDDSYSYDFILDDDNKVFNVFYKVLKIDIDSDSSFLSNLSHSFLGNNIPNEFSFCYSIVEFIIAVFMIIAFCSPFFIVYKIIKAVL